MALFFEHAAGINELGLRALNEDSVYPPLIGFSAQKESRFYLVCDGVGGEESGEIASKLVCDSFSNYFENLLEINLSNINEAISLAQDNMSNHLKSHPQSNGMATTLSFVFCNPKGIFVAHVGDSRVYQFRNGNLLFCTKNHSIVEEMVTDGLITAEQAINHPRRNVITRAILGAERPTFADVEFITDVLPGDYFFLCSDGIWEGFENIQLAQCVCDRNMDNFQKIEYIQSATKSRAKDNYSAYLVSVGSSEDQPINDHVHELIKSKPIFPGSKTTQLDKLLWIAIVIALLAIVLLFYI